ncbi:unnamed protein product [Ambrosiozyma monospora]|uniref:Unnamed protein product n=1 Tax=Ambrosiozyma monospora TaxID=43982 RepID=A0ACB5T5T9_AMBMO|nr:unnamed protein product [Ambrosiozyma monospora]
MSKLLTSIKNVKLPFFIPQLRHVPDDFDYSKPYIPEEQGDAPKDDSSYAEDPNYIQLEDGNYVRIKEFRDEANRPWYKFFDEYEYRETPQEAKEYKWWHWFEEGSTAEEKKLVIKLDLLIAFYSFVGYWIKYVDSANLNNAYVSNMKEDLGFKGNDLINTQTLFNAAAAIFTFPSMYVLGRVPLNYYMFGVELCWSLFTLGIYRVENVTQLQILRWFVATFEGMYYPCIHYLLANWYRPSEISRRGSIFYAGQFLGVLTSGLIASSTFSSLDGVNGLAGWRWMFIVDGAMSAAVAILALFSLPGTPMQCYSLWLTDNEIRLARRRMHKGGSEVTSHVKSFLDKSLWKELLTSWRVYWLSLVGTLFFNTNSTNSGSFALWLKSLDKWSVPRVNTLTTIPPALGIGYILITGFGADITRKRFGMVAFSLIMNFIGMVVLAIWDVPYKTKWFGFCFGFWSWCHAPVFYPLVNDIYRRNSSLRPMAWTVIYGMGCQSQVWISKLSWPTTESPRFKTER